MVKDGSGWGAHVGLTAALLARDGFTGAPALTVEHDHSNACWTDLGSRWRISEQYFKAYPVCRWAQPAIEAALALQRTHDFTDGEIVSVEIETFREAVLLGSGCAAPETTEDAQYSLPFRWRQRWYSERLAQSKSLRRRYTIGASPGYCH
jgi:2-methylcitrate dehydratase PrpD